jgi:hypothetical protein
MTMMVGSIMMVVGAMMMAMKLRAMMLPLL